MTVFAALAPPTPTLPNDKLGGVVVTGCVPVPESEAVCGLPAALSFTVRAPVRDPVAVGWKYTVTVQNFAAANVLGGTGHLLVLIWKSPLVVMLEIVSALVSAFLTVNVFVALVPPTGSLPKLALVGFRVTD